MKNLISTTKGDEVEIFGSYFIVILNFKNELFIVRKNDGSGIYYFDFKKQKLEWIADEN